MSIPTPRAATEGGGEMGATVTSMITDALREVKDAVGQLSRDMHDQLSKMPELYVPRREVERRFDELVVDVKALELKVDQAEQRRSAAATQAEQERRTARRYLITTAIAAGGALVGVVGGLANHIS